MCQEQNKRQSFKKGTLTPCAQKDIVHLVNPISKTSTPDLKEMIE